jgi:hypothetical protein
VFGFAEALCAAWQVIPRLRMIYIFTTTFIKGQSYRYEETTLQLWHVSDL